MTGQDFHVFDKVSTVSGDNQSFFKYRQADSWQGGVSATGNIFSWSQGFFNGSEPLTWPLINKNSKLPIVSL